jgi:hypothetical protein
MMSKNEHVEYRYSFHEDSGRISAEEDFADIIINKNIKTERLPNLTLPITKVQKHVTEDIFRNPNQNGLLGVNVGGKSKKVLVGLNVDYKIEGLELTPFDLKVHNLICSHHFHGQNEISTATIARELIGLTESKDENYKFNRRTKLLEDIRQSLIKMTAVIVTIDHTQQAIKHSSVVQDNDLKSKKITETILSGRFEEEKLYNGNKSEYFHLYYTPPLFEYAQLYNQIATVDPKLIDTRSLRHDKKVVTLKFELVELIESFKNQKNSVKSSEVKFKTLFKRAGMIDLHSDKKQRYSITKQIERLLTVFKENSYIKGYSFQGNSVTGKIIIKV